MGQFWTPDWIAESMVRYALGGDSNHVFDPAHGMGAFFVAAKKLESELGRRISFYGTDIDPELIAEIKKQGELSSKDLSKLQLADFTEIALNEKYDAIVVNPPYIRHHRISADKKTKLREIARTHLGLELDGRAGLHVYFLILSLLSLKENGRLSFIVSSDICEGVFAKSLWDWISANFRIDGVLTFTGKATPFPGVDTNPIIFFIRNSPPAKKFSWAKVIERNDKAINKWVNSSFKKNALTQDLLIHERSLDEALSTGLSRVPQLEKAEFTLGDFVYAMRGIATGNNEYFLLNQEVIKKFGIPKKYLVPAVGRTRDVTGDVIDETTFEQLAEKGRPYNLLYIGKRDIETLPKSIRNYILHGESRGVHKTPLIASRKVWYQMEQRDPPPILFAYLGRRSSRFIRNEAQALPLNGFLCIYPKRNVEDKLEELLEVINHSQVLENLFLVGKSYGSDAVKVEPRAIERLPLPGDLVRGAGLAA